MNHTLLVIQKLPQLCLSLESNGEVTWRKLTKSFPGLAADLRIHWVVAVHA